MSLFNAFEELLLYEKFCPPIFFSFFFPPFAMNFVYHFVCLCKRSVHSIQVEKSPFGFHYYYYFVGLAYQCKDIVFRFIIEYSSLRDFGP
jgi:hypothetical protein